MTINMRDAKAEGSRSLDAGSPGLAAILAQPDALDEATFDALVPTWLRLLFLRKEG